MQFFNDVVVLDLNLDDGDGDDDENEYQRSLVFIENVFLFYDDFDLFKIREVKICGCGCKNKCVFIFSDDILYLYILNMREMLKEEKDMYIMGLFVDSCKEMIKWGKKRICFRQIFMFFGEKVCRNMFLFVYDIGKYFFYNIIIYKNIYGVILCKYGNLGKKFSYLL